MAGSAYKRKWELSAFDACKDKTHGIVETFYNAERGKLEQRYIGPYTEKEAKVEAKLADARRDFLQEVERVAHLMCEEMGVDPEEVVQAQFEEILLPHEKHFNTNPHLKKSERFELHPVAIKRWELMRPHAAVALAGFRAVNRFFLSEK